MSLLPSFEPGLRVAVFGASGGVGAALHAALLEDDRVAQIYAAMRQPFAAPRPKTISLRFDLTAEASIAEAAARIAADGPLDIVIVATGVLHDGEELKPEKSLRDFSGEAFARAFAINATGPALIAKNVLPLLSRDRRSVFAALSARVGSIEDNHLGGWAAYRASKAALHQIIRTCAIELARKNNSAVCVALHPGTVETDLSAPFQRNVEPQKLFAPRYSAERLLTVINGLTPTQSGQVFAWNGERIPF